VVVSKPAARNTHLAIGFSLAIFAASSGLAIGRSVGAAALACSSERGSLFGAFHGHAQHVAVGHQDHTLAQRELDGLVDVLLGQMHTGQPGPGTSSMFAESPCAGRRW